MREVFSNLYKCNYCGFVFHLRGSKKCNRCGSPINRGGRYDRYNLDSDVIDSDVSDLETGEDDNDNS